MKSVARIIDVAGGYAVSDDSLDYIDTRGRVYATVREAMVAARQRTYTHYISYTSSRCRRLYE